MRARLLVAVVGMGLTAVSVPLASATSAGTLALRGTLSMRSVGAPCPPEAPSGVDCFSRTGTGLVRGLGRVSEAYFYFARIGCGTGGYTVEGATARLTVEGKGAIEVTLGGNPECRPQFTYGLSRPFTVTGGSGAYAEASGSGTLTHAGSQTAQGVVGTDTWAGTAVVPGLEFDLEPPTISGAATKTVRARKGEKRVRVSYQAAARDDVDGSVAVACRPASGGRFKIGRTVVRCSATDTSANTATATFMVVVKAR